MNTKKLLFDLCSCMSISGFEYRSAEKLRSLVMPYFDEYIGDKVGNHIFVKKSKSEKAPKLLLDTHFDEVGLMVKDVTKEGFLRVCSIGGVDARIFPASEVTVYAGEKEISGVVVKKAPHARTPDEAGKLTAVTNLLVDTGYSKAELEELGVGIGTPVGMAKSYISLSDDVVSGPSFDNKSCCAAAVYAVSMLVDCGCDIYLSMSAKEEVGHRAASSAAYTVNPDFAIAIDVGLGLAPGGDKKSNPKLGGGACISVSAILDRAFTDRIIETAKKNEIPLQVIVEACGTGTHADEIGAVREGIPTALLSLPINFMHTGAETLYMSDFEATAKLICAVINDCFAGGEKA